MAPGCAYDKTETAVSDLILGLVTQVKVFAEFIIAIRLDGFANPAQQFLKVVQIVDGIEPRAQNLAAFIEMSQIGS